MTLSNSELVVQGVKCLTAAIGFIHLELDIVTSYIGLKVDVNTRAHDTV